MHPPPKFDAFCADRRRRCTGSRQRTASSGFRWRPRRRGGTARRTHASLTSRSGVDPGEREDLVLVHHRAPAIAETTARHRRAAEVRSQPRIGDVPRRHGRPPAGNGFSRELGSIDTRPRCRFVDADRRGAGHAHHQRGDERGDDREDRPPRGEGGAALQLRFTGDVALVDDCVEAGWSYWKSDSALEVELASGEGTTASVAARALPAAALEP